MVLGLFKSKEKRIAEAREREFQETVDLLEKLDLDQRGAIALHCATIRLAETSVFAGADPELAEMGRLVWYDPLKADDYALKVTLDRLYGKMHETATQLAGAADDPGEMTQQLVLLTAIKAHCLTWLSCAEPTFQPLARQMWALIATGFPEVENLVARAKADADPLNKPETIAEADRAIADGPHGPEYRRIPAGFAPDAAA